MIPLSTRQCMVLGELMLADGPLTIAELASRLGLTPRMVRYDLGAIGGWLEERDAKLIKRPSFGILIDAPASLKPRLWRNLEHLQGYYLVLSPDERVEIVLLVLLTRNQPAVAKELALQLGVSYPTTLADLRRAERWLNRRNLEVLRRRHVGFLVAGSEIDRREATLELLLPRFEERQLATHGAGTRSAIGHPQTPSSYLETLELELAEEVVATLEKLMRVSFTDRVRNVLLLGAAILVARVQQGKTVQMEDKTLARVKETQEFRVARLATADMAQRLSLRIPDSEAAYLAMQLLGASTARNLHDMVAEDDLQDIDAGLLEVVTSLVSEASMYLQPCLRADRQLIRNLALHLGPALNRLRYGLPIRNPLLSEVKKQYPYLFEVAERASAAVQRAEGTRIPPEEIAYIAMHLGAAMERFRTARGRKTKALVVCGEGTAATWLLVSRIRSELPNVEVVEVAPGARSSRLYMPADEVALIISTAALEAARVPTVTVNPLLTPADVATIRAALDAQIRSTGPSMVRTPTVECRLADLLQVDTIALQVHATSWVDVVEQAGNLLVAVGAIELEYVEAMRSMIDEHGPYVVIMPGVALLHAPPGTGVNRICMSIVTLRKPVPFGHRRYDPVGVAVALGTVDSHSHWRALYELMELLNDPRSAAAVRTARTKQTVLKLALAFSAADRRAQPGCKRAA
jgi:mannitol operon transcriptional antiterminator